MATKLRFARHGSKKKPFYWLVAANSRSARDGDFIEKLGTYNPLLVKDDVNRLNFNKERIAYWLSNGAIPSERTEKLLEIANINLPPKLKATKDRKENSRKAAASLKAAKAAAEAQKAAEAEAKALAKEEAKVLSAEVAAVVEDRKEDASVQPVPHSEPKE